MPVTKVFLFLEHKQYFQLTHLEGIFTLQLTLELPPEVIYYNNILTFSLEVETERERTHATIILELIKPDITPLAFDDDFYVGSYSEIKGFIFESLITLESGYDETVLFALEGGKLINSVVELWFK